MKKKFIFIFLYLFLFKIITPGDLTEDIYRNITGISPIKKNTGLITELTDEMDSDIDHILRISYDRLYDPQDGCEDSQELCCRELEKYLKRKLISPNAYNRTGETILIKAVKYSKTTCVRWLAINNKVDIYAKVNGETAYDIAYQKYEYAKRQTHHDSYRQENECYEIVGILQNPVSFWENTDCVIL